MHLAAARASAAGFAGHGIEIRRLDFDVAGRSEAYKHLNTRLHGALQWSCILLARTLPGSRRIKKQTEEIKSADQKQTEEIASPK